MCSERHGPLVERMKSVMEKELEVIVREERWAGLCGVRSGMGWASMYIQCPS